MTVLLADGEWQSRFTAYCYLTAHGLHVLPADDGTEARHVVREHKIDVLIVDVSCGLELARTIGAEILELPTIFISSGSGVAGVPALHKPVAFDQLMTAISNLLYSAQAAS